MNTSFNQRANLIHSEYSSTKHLIGDCVLTFFLCQGGSIIRMLEKIFYQIFSLQKITFLFTSDIFPINLIFLLFASTGGFSSSRKSSNLFLIWNFSLNCPCLRIQATVWVSTHYIFKYPFYKGILCSLSVCPTAAIEWPKFQGNYLVTWILNAYF